jgi:hypothetical protein
MERWDDGAEWWGRLCNAWGQGGGVAERARACLAGGTGLLEGGSGDGQWVGHADCVRRLRPRMHVGLLAKGSLMSAQSLIYIK